MTQDELKEHEAFVKRVKGMLDDIARFKEELEWLSDPNLIDYVSLHREVGELRNATFSRLTAAECGVIVQLLKDGAIAKIAKLEREFTDLK